MTDLELFESRLGSVRDASQRGRWVFAILSVASVAQLAGVWNISLSWVRNFALSANWPKDDKVVEHLQKKLLDTWVDSTFISVPIFGVRMSISDASLIGALALTILSLWFFYCMRRENHLIGQLLRDASHCSDKRAKSFVFHGVYATQVFATVSDNDEPIRSLSDAEGRHKPFPGVRFFVKCLFFLPAVAIGCSVLSDILSLWVMRAPFREGHPVISKALLNDAGPGTWGQVVLILGAGLMLLVMSATLCRQSTRYQEATITLLGELQNWAGHEAPPQSPDQPPPPPARTAPG